MENADSLGQSIYSLSWNEFRADITAWLLAGVLMGVIYLAYFGAPLSTGIKVLIGSVCFGLFGGMMSFLAFERQIIDRIQSLGQKVPVHPKKILSVSRKILFFMLSVLLFMVISILLMIFMDIQYLLSNRSAFGPGTFFGVFKEILFAFSVLFFMSLFILGRYSSNLKAILANQLSAMESIIQGEYETNVPVVSNDEFGLIAAKTNDMISGLQERDHCQISFGKYVAPEISEKILGGEISQEGEMSTVTMLFCDLRGYTPLVEKKDPKDVVRFLNTYFTEMEQAIRQYNGIVLQYIGDEIEAVFGYPVLEPLHPEKAVLAALEMRKRLTELNSLREVSGEEPVRHGIGIHTGSVLAGSVGSPDRLTYAMVGDTVNTAARIQDLNKQFGTDILMSHATKDLLEEGMFELTSLGETAVKGKTQSIRIYTIA